MKATLRQKQIQNGRQSLYIEYYDKGKREYEFLNLFLEPEKRGDKITKNSNKETLELAKQIKAQREIEIANDSFGFQAKNKRKLNFIAYAENIKKSKTAGTQKTYKILIDYIIKFNKSETLELHNINNIWIDSFIKFLKKQDNLAHNTIWLLSTKLKVVILDLYRQELISKNPYLKVKEKITQKKVIKNYLTLDEIQMVINTDCKPKHNNLKYAFLFSCFCGLRFSDLQALTWRNIRDDMIHIRQQKTQEPLIIPLTKPAKQILALLPKENDKLFNLTFHTTCNRLVRHIISLAKIDKSISFHSARHSFAVNYLTLGGDIYVLKELLGHKDIASTEIYAKIVNERKQQAANLFPEIEL